MDRFMKMERDQAVLIVIDVQDVLMKKMDREVGEKVLQNIQTLLTFAKGMAIPILITEQYPKGLGNTVADIRMEMRSILPIEKVSFSCSGVVAFHNQLNSSGEESDFSYRHRETCVCASNSQRSHPRRL